MQDRLKNIKEQLWEPSSWRSKPIKQQVIYEDQEALKISLNKLRSLPPLVNLQEILQLKKKLKDVAFHKSFFLQGGDCAESFNACTSDLIDSKLKIILQMSIILNLGINIPVVKIARIAGQYSKPRSNPTEIIDGKEVLSFRGECINGYPLDQRKPSPERMIMAYFHSSATLNYIRSSLSSNKFNLYTLLESDISFLKKSQEENYFPITHSSESFNFKKIIEMDTNPQLQIPDIFISHEGLLLEYEECMTREIKDPETNETKWWNLGAHFLWIGDRTRNIDGAHVEYFRGIGNPIGIKIGPLIKPDELIKLLDIVDPKKEVGKVTLIFRYGYNKIKEYLPQHIEAIQSSGHKVILVCDPMHGNTLFSTKYPHLKTRNFSHILLELKSCFDICKAYGTRLNGVHIEMTGEGVTECLGGSIQLEDKDLLKTYQTLCDPRLNYEQSLEISFLITKYWKESQSIII